MDKLEEFLQNNQYNVNEVIDSFLKEGDTLYALSFCDIVLDSIEERLKNTDCPDKEQLLNEQFQLKLRVNYSKKKDKLCKSGDELDDYRKLIAKKNLHKIDGMESLVAELGEDKFIKMAIEDSYFFSKELVIKQNEVLKKSFNSDKEVSARKTQKGVKPEEYGQTKNEKGEWTYSKDDFRCKITRDSDGNKDVRSNIKTMTGYTVCEGKGSIFQNYVISHIWGCAYDPRYFTSFWNIVLVPAWANSLMDKDATEGSLESKLKATFMTICKKEYDFSNITWADIKLKRQPDVQYQNDVLSGDYKIKVINKKKDKSKSAVASIEQKEININNSTQSVIEKN